MQSEIQTLPWMSAATKEQALIKLHAIAKQDWLIPTPGVTTAPSKSCAGTKSATRNVHHGFEFHRQLAKIGKPVDRNRRE